MLRHASRLRLQRTTRLSRALIQVRTATSNVSNVSKLAQSDKSAERPDLEQQVRDLKNVQEYVARKRKQDLGLLLGSSPILMGVAWSIPAAIIYSPILALYSYGAAHHYVHLSAAKLLRTHLSIIDSTLSQGLREDAQQEIEIATRKFSSEINVSANTTSTMRENLKYGFLITTLLSIPEVLMDGTVSVGFIMWSLGLFAARGLGEIKAARDLQQRFLK